MDASGIPPTYPFHLAKAYSGAGPAARSGPGAGFGAGPGAVSGAGPGAVSGTGSGAASGVAKGVDSFEISKPRAASVGGLVAWKFAVAPNFAAAPAESGSLQMYRHPADKNAAATGVSVGRAVDLDAYENRQG